MEETAEQTPNTEGQTPNTEGQTPNTEGQTPNTEGQTPNTEGQTPNTEGQTPNTEDIVTIGEEDSQPQQEAPDWVKDLRKQQRITQAENKRLKKELEQYIQPENITNIKKPTLEECDFDSEIYEKKLETYYDNKRKIEEKQKKIEEEEKKQKESWNNVLTTYQQKRDTLNVNDFEDAEGVVMDILSETQQGIILKGAENPAMMVYALGKNLKKAKELSDITDPIQFAVELGKLETQTKVSKKRPSVKPEKLVTGSENIQTNNKKLKELEEEAQRTGDYTQFFQYKNSKRT